VSFNISDLKHKTFVKTLQIKDSVHLVLFGSKLGSSKILSKYSVKTRKCLHDNLTGMQEVVSY